MLTTEDSALHAEMAGYWTRFVATCNPNRGESSAASWPPVKRLTAAGADTTSTSCSNRRLAGATAARTTMRLLRADLLSLVAWRASSWRSVRCFKPMAGAQELTLVESLTR
jgi:hypothetical protein